MQLLTSVVLASALLAFACSAPPAGPEEGSTDSALSTSVSVARACAVRAAYTKADLTDLKPQTLASLPTEVRNFIAKQGLTSSSSASHGELPPYVTVYSLSVPAVGRVFIFDATAADTSAALTSDVEIVDEKGNEIADLLEEDGQRRWYMLARVAEPVDGGELPFPSGARLLECDP